jgi:hypothetical protein
VTAPATTQRLQVWLPLPPDDSAQHVLRRQLSTFPLAVEPQIATEKQFGNTFAYFEFQHPQGAQEIRHQFQIRVWQLDWQLDPARVVPVESWPSAFDPYRRSEVQAVVVNDQVSDLLAKIVPQRGNPLTDMGTIISWVNQNLSYDHGLASLRGSSLNALTRRGGHCSDYHGLCASLGRVLGQPTRITYGLHAFEKASPSHCKLDVYLPPYGWVSFDVSETQKQIASIQANTQLDEAERRTLAAAAQRRLLSGSRDNTWFLQTRGSDYELVPPASGRVPLVRTIYAEADGVPLPDPDPSDPTERQFAWMTLVRIESDRPVEYPFQGIKSLK